MGLVEGGYKPVPRDDFQKTGGGSRGWQGGGGGGSQRACGKEIGDELVMWLLYCL